jgi:hypothetical protein
MSSDGIDVTLSWESPLPVDDLQTVQAYVLLKSIGVSNSSIMRKLGYDPEEEARLSQAEDAQAMANNPLMQNQMPPTQPGVAGLPGQPPAQTPLQGGNQQSGGQQ